MTRMGNDRSLPDPAWPFAASALTSPTTKLN